MQPITVGIVGGAGYTGGELLRLLINHPYAHISFVHSRSNAGKSLSAVHRDLAGDIDLAFTAELKHDVDVLFLCVGHGEAKKFLQENKIAQKTKVIDLSQDFRLQANCIHGDRVFIYGLPEINRNQIKSAHNVANPGCFATAIQLGLLPLAKSGLMAETYTTGITGSTGAGQGLSETSHFSWRANNIQAYKTLTHQHLKEIYQSLASVRSTESNAHHIVNFVPWRGDFTRGIFVSSTLHCEWSLEKVVEIFDLFYEGHPFTIVKQDTIYLKQVVNTNKCLLQLEKAGTKLVVHSALDNLLKGASGQALQNMNLMFGFEEKTGLKLKASAF